MAGMMVQFHHPGPGPAPTIAEAAARLDVPAGALDRGFGVIATDPDARLFTVLIEPGAADRAIAALRLRGSGHPAEGVFGDAKIAPMGPPSD
jgi:hypothetical protein